MIDKSNHVMQAMLLRSAMNSASDAFIVVNRANEVIEWSEKADKLFGWKRDEAVGRTLSTLIIPAKMRARHEQGLKKHLTTGKRTIMGKPIRVTAVHKDRREIPIELTINAFDLGKETFFCASIRDNLHQLLYENSLKQQVALLNLSRDSIFVCDLDQKLLFWNDGARHLFNYTKEEAVGRFAYELLKSIYPKPLEEIRQDLLDTRHWEGEVIHHSRDGTPIAMLSRWALDVDTHGEPTRILISGTDITYSKQYQNHIEYLATHDVLTGLPNRVQLEDRLLHAIERARRRQGWIAILSFTLNRFKVINDGLGHDKGDLLLREIAQRLIHIVGEGNIVARVGAEEFVICLEKVNGIEDIHKMAERILKAASQPIDLAEQDIFISANVGISIYPKDGIDHTVLLHSAGMAMHQAKQFGSGVFRFYSPEMNVRVLERLRIENALHGAIERQELIVHYQPRLCASTKKLVAVEALVRWNDPEKGMTAPSHFIPLAEDLGLIGAIGEWVLRSACAQNKQWQRMGLGPFKVSVNLSPRQLGSSSVQQTVSRVLADTQLDAKYLELEVTESGLMENIESAHQTLTEIRRTGVVISIDDFGTGYSSLAHLKKLPIDALKIDRSFIRDLGRGPSDAAIITATIAMAKGMNLKVVAEGVETQEQVDFLIDHRCDELQGYYFSPAVPASELENALRQGWWT